MEIFNSARFLLFYSVFLICFVYGRLTGLADQVTLLFVGDITFSGPVRYYVEHNHQSYNTCFVEVASFIRGADFSVANLETPLVNATVFSHKCQKQVVLDSSPQSASSLRFAGFNAVSVANNHFNDFGDVGANFTVNVLKSTGIDYFGATYGPFNSSQVPLIIEKKALKIGFLGYCHHMTPKRIQNCSEMRMKFKAGPAIYSKDIAERDVNRLKSKVDIVVVYIHWGRELFLKPVPYQLQVTDHLLSLGVHLIIGSHSHVIQPHSIHGNRLVKFGLGNFFFPPARVPGGNDPRIYGRLGLKPDEDRIAIYEKLALEEGEFFKTSQLFRVKVSRKGVEFADYLPVKLAFDSAKKQVYIKPENDLLWIEVCSDEDPQCQRSNT